MYRINNQGVAAGYIATQSASGPYLPTTYTGGQFHTMGLESLSYVYTVNGLNDQGVIVGNLTDAAYNNVPYISRKGIVEYPAIPADVYPTFYGINNAGVAYGSKLESSSVFKLDLFTLKDGSLNTLPISAPGMVHFDSNLKQFSDGGLLAVTGYSEDFSVSQNYLYDIPTDTLSQVAVPNGFDWSRIEQVTESGLIFGTAFTNDFSQVRHGFWNADGTFGSFFDAPDALYHTIQINNIGQAIYLNPDDIMFFDGTKWSERQTFGLNGSLLESNGYSLGVISDFNDRGQFVGLAYNSQHTFLWGFTASPAPEPSGALLFGMGLCSWLGCVALRRRRASAV